MLKLLKSGFYTTLQDRGRFNYRNKGVPVSGCMDAISAERVNELLENDTNAAVLEITMTGPTISFDKPTFIALGGAELSATINNAPIKNYEVYKIEPGDILSYGKLEKGYRAYLGIKNGIKRPIVLGSKSMYSSITEGDYFKDNSELEYEPCPDFVPVKNIIKKKTYVNDTVLEVYRGPEYDQLTNKQLEALFFNMFAIAMENNRMAYQLKEKIDEHSVSMLTSSTLPGTVQLTPSGKIIILMKDGQTTGGYPRILQLSSMAISILAQKKYGDFITFKLI